MPVIWGEQQRCLAPITKVGWLGKKSKIGLLRDERCYNGGERLITSNPMTKSLKWRAGLERFIANCDATMELLGVDNDVNLLRKVETLLKEVEEGRKLKGDWMSITGTSDIGNAKRKTLSLMILDCERTTTSK